MKYTDPRLRELLAGEYALGALHGAARARFETLLRHDPELRRLVDAWQSRLTPLAGETPPVLPAARVWDRIERRIRAAPADRQRPWWRRTRFWQALAAANLALVLALAGYVVLRPAPPAAGVEAGLYYVSVLTDAADRTALTVIGYGPPWRLEINPRARLAPVAGAELRLWMRDGGATPRFLARFDGVGEDLRLSPQRWDLMAGARELLVSRDPAGSPTSSGPRGEILFAGPCAGLRHPEAPQSDS